MVNEPKRLSFATAANSVGQQLSVRFGPGTGSILRRLTNYHNIWFGVGVEPETADANANGTWVLWEKRDTNASDTQWSIANLNSDNFNMQIIACGVFVASNQTPWNFSSQLKSSRNFVANQELVFSLRLEGVSAGNVRVNMSLCAGVAVK